MSVNIQQFYPKVAKNTHRFTQLRRRFHLYTRLAKKTEDEADGWAGVLLDVDEFFFGFVLVVVLPVGLVFFGRVFLLYYFDWELSENNWFLLICWFLLFEDRVHLGNSGA